MFGALTRKVKGMTADSGTQRGFMLWIDGVGAWMLCLQPTVTIGGPAIREQADISLMANLSRLHATITRIEEDWFIEPHGHTQVARREITRRTPLRSNTTITLAERVELRFRQPTALSATGVLDFVSDHRPAQTVDGIVLIHETCLLGPGPENHVVCSDWPDSLVLFQRQGTWRCKSRMNLAVDGRFVTDAHEVKAGSVITGDDMRLRIEAI